MKSDTERTSARAEKPTRSSSTQNVADTQTLFRLALNVEINPCKTISFSGAICRNELLEKAFNPSILNQVFIFLWKEKPDSNSSPPDATHLPSKLSCGHVGWWLAPECNAKEIGSQSMHSKTVPLYYVVDMFYKYTTNVSISSVNRISFFLILSHCGENFRTETQVYSFDLSLFFDFSWKRWVNFSTFQSFDRKISFILKCSLSEKFAPRVFVLDFSFQFEWPFGFFSTNQIFWHLSHY